MNEDSARRMTTDQIEDKGQNYKEASRWCCESEAGQAFSKGSHQVQRQMTGGKYKYTAYVYILLYAFKCFNRHFYLTDQISYVELRKRSAKWKKRALYFT